MPRKWIESSLMAMCEQANSGHGWHCKVCLQYKADRLPLVSGEYTRFANDWGFKITKRSPKCSTSNGEAERAVQTARSILKKKKNQAKALLAYRSTPLSCGYPPFHSLLNPKFLEISRLHQRGQTSRFKQGVNFNRRHRAAPFSTLQPDTEVVTTSDGQPGIHSRRVTAKDRMFLKHQQRTFVET